MWPAVDSANFPNYSKHNEANFFSRSVVLISHAQKPRSPDLADRQTDINLRLVHVRGAMSGCVVYTSIEHDKYQWALGCILWTASIRH